jgi:hypothetical protein
MFHPEKPKEKGGKWMKTLNALTLLLAAGALGFMAASLTSDSRAQSFPEAAFVVGEEAESESETAERSPGQVLGEGDEVAFGVFKSENYAIGQISIAGEASFETDDLRPLEISFVRGESFLEKNQKDVKILITWKTSKPAQSSIKYGKNNGETTRTVTEDGYGTDHSVILSNLDQASTYIYSITAKDRYGSRIATDTYAVYTGSKTASLFDLISGAVTDAFGWAIKD